MSDASYEWRKAERDAGRWPNCEFFAPRSDMLTKDIVVQCAEPAGDGPLHFYVPVLHGCAVRVPVCATHLPMLEEHAAAEAK